MGASLNIHNQLKGEYNLDIILFEWGIFYNLINEDAELKASCTKGQI